jgi:cysteinyl-tRNA synthetase
LNEVRRSLDGFYRFFDRYERITGQSFYAVQAPWKRRDDFDPSWAVGEGWDEVLGLRQKFLECMDDDFNTGGATGALYELLTALNRYAEKKQLEGAGAGAQPARAVFQKQVVVLRELSQVLGLFGEPPRSASGGEDNLVGGLMQLLIDLRAEARKAKNFALGDQIRKRLGELGVTLEDRPGGTGWRRG